MVKKLIELTVAVLLLFSLAACKGVSLEQYKAAAKAEIENYAQENIDMVCGLVEREKNAIEVAANKAAVDRVLAESIQAIDEAVQKINRLLRYTQISPEIRAEIDRLYFMWFESNYTSGLSLAEVSRLNMGCYHGQYNGFYVFNYSGWGFSFSETIIDGLTFKTHSLGGILALREDYASTLEEVYKNGYLNRADLEKIHEINIEYWAARY